MKMLALALFLPLAALGAETHDLPQVNDLLESQGAASALRESTPDPSFGGRGRQIGWVKKGERLRTLETRLYLTIFGTEIWIEVEKDGDPSVHGWVFDGMTREVQDGQASFAVVQKAKEAEDPRDAAERESARDADRLVQDLGR
jgi:hypothetical protein